ncbi:hypothetical protein DEO72_LG2g1666 [Vigna unguiculata]|uniref:Uncharacterized protein n=1 Tax=Vigna unguiculata TaxID=3917 RepID=A0A4D6L0D1_VIGUN|nr:hypothetical protein DEO72_LG2g1666 [Vigna unguiculata]
MGSAVSKSGGAISKYWEVWPQAPPETQAYTSGVGVENPGMLELRSLFGPPRPRPPSQRRRRELGADSSSVLPFLTSAWLNPSLHAIRIGETLTRRRWLDEWVWVSHCIGGSRMMNRGSPILVIFEKLLRRTSIGDVVRFNGAPPPFVSGGWRHHWNPSPDPRLRAPVGLFLCGAVTLFLPSDVAGVSPITTGATIHVFNTATIRPSGDRTRSFISRPLI